MTRTLALDFGDQDPSTTAGTTLKRVEVYNWGTFDGLHTLTLDGKSALLTGANGAGKSTLVDAISVLMTQHTRFNQAAAESDRERSISSYSVGTVGQTLGEHGETYKTDLRSVANGPVYTVVLAIFENHHTQQSSTVGLVHREEQSTYTTRYLTAAKELTVARDVLDADRLNFNELLARLRGRDVQVFDTKVKYLDHMRTLLGIQTREALALFQKTVSMKTIPDTNRFIREDMLRKRDLRGEARRLLEGHDSLKDHLAQRENLKRKIELLDRIIGELTARSAAAEELQNLTEVRESTERAFARREHQMLREREERKADILKSRRQAREEATNRRDHARAIVRRLAQSGDAAASSVAQLEEQIDVVSGQLARAERVRKHLDVARVRLGLGEAVSGSNLERLKAEVKTLPARYEAEKRREEASDRRRELDAHAHELAKQLQHFRSSKTNLNQNLVELRDDLCVELGLDAEDIPFVGELIQVPESANRWESAANRLLAAEASKLVVSDDLKDSVALWLEQQRSRYRVKVRYHVRGAPSGEEPHPGSIVELLEFANHPAASWVRGHLSRSFPHVGVERPEDLNDYSHAVTVRGQIKSGRYRERDLRPQANDRVLGWDTRANEEATFRLLSTVHEKLKRATADVESKARAVRTLDEAAGTLEQADVADIATEVHERNLTGLREQLTTLRASSPNSARRAAELAAAEREEADASARLDAATQDVGEAEAWHRAAREDLARLPLLEGDTSRSTVGVEQLQEITDRHQLGQFRTREFESVQRTEDAVRTRLAKSTAEAEIIMQEFSARFPAEAAALTTTVESEAEWRELREGNIAKQGDLLDALAQNLPEFVETNVNHLRSAYMESQRGVSDELEDVNSALEAIDFGEDAEGGATFLRIDKRRSSNRDIAEFRKALDTTLRQDLTGVVDDPEKLVAMMDATLPPLVSILSPLRDPDSRAARNVERMLDGRYAFTYHLSEVSRATGEVTQTYGGSGGKSGGQQAQLAYTLLSAALSMHYGLTVRQSQSSTFRLVLVDEAFATNDATKTRYALNQFRQLGLQMLMVTPADSDKIFAIQDFIQHVSVVNADTDSRSWVSDFPIEEVTKFVGGSIAA